MNKSVLEYCLEYTKRPHDRSYVDNILLEWYPGKVFKTNFEYESVCIGVMPTGHVIPHIDDGRDSTLIVPFNEITITQNDIKTTYTEPFLLDTNIPHSADSIVNGMFIAFDFFKRYDEAKTYIDSFFPIEISV